MSTAERQRTSARRSEPLPYLPRALAAVTSAAT